MRFVRPTSPISRRMSASTMHLLSSYSVARRRVVQNSRPIHSKPGISGHIGETSNCIRTIGPVSEKITFACGLSDRVDALDGPGLGRSSLSQLLSSLLENSSRTPCDKSLGICAEEDYTP